MYFKIQNRLANEIKTGEMVNAVKRQISSIRVFQICLNVSPYKKMRISVFTYICMQQMNKPKQADTHEDIHCRSSLKL